MKNKILNTIWVMGVLSIAVFCLSACDHELDIQQAYPFTVETMPVQKHIAKGQTAEIRCTLKRQGRFEDARYTIRYFQPDGRGRLKMDNGTVFKPNDRYPLNKEEFRLYYTSASTDQQTIDVYVEDNFGQTAKLSFEFNSQKDEEKEKKDEEEVNLSSSALSAFPAYGFLLRMEEIYFYRFLRSSVPLSASSTLRAYTGSRTHPMSDMVISCKRENALRQR